MNSVALVILWDGAAEGLARYLQSCQWQLAGADGLYVVRSGAGCEQNAGPAEFSSLAACAEAITQDLAIVLTPRVLLAPFILAHLRPLTVGLGVLLGARRWVEGAHAGYSNPASSLPGPAERAGTLPSQFVFHPQLLRRVANDLPTECWPRELPAWLAREKLHAPRSPLPIVYERRGKPAPRGPVGVVITVFSEPESYLRRAVASCWHQLEPGDDLVVVKGAGGAADLRCLDPVGFPGLRLLEDDSLEVGGGRNAGLRLTTAPWIKFLDGDDVLAPYALEALAEPVPDQVQVLYGGMVFLRDGRYWKLQPAAGVNLECLPYWNPFVPAPTLIRRQGLLEVGAFDPAIGFEEDYDLWLRFAQRGGLEAFAPLPQVLAYYWAESERRSVALRRRRYLVEGLPVRDYFRRRYGVECVFHEHCPQAGGLPLEGRRPPVTVA